MVKYPQYNYILAGGGMAGLSLAFYMSQLPFFKDKTILIVDKEKKEKNDRTFCFWQSENSVFEPIITQKWPKILFFGNDHQPVEYALAPFEYKMLKGIDFYNFIYKNLENHSNISFKYEAVEAIDSENNLVKTAQQNYQATEYIFDSVFRPSFNKDNQNNLLQHFLGWTITTQDQVFDITLPTLFDFRVPQETECRFVYVLPESPTKALIEFTIFSDNLLQQADYERILKNYIQSILGIAHFEITDTEYGVIPMSDENVAQNTNSKIIKIGTAGGFVKASTGYSFERTQAKLQQMALDISQNKHPLASLKSTVWKNYMDSVLLHVIKLKRIPQDQIFTALFHKNGASQLFKFLKGDTNLWEDIKLMNTVPKLPFIKSAISQFGKLFN